MTRLQLFVLALAALLLMGLYFGADIKPSTQAKVDQKRALSATSMDANVLINKAKENLSVDAINTILALESELGKASDDSLKIAIYKQLSGSWYDLKRVDVAGIYAEKVAEIDNGEDAWAIAATTFTIGAREAKEEILKQFCVEKAMQAYENVISINPSNVTHRVNQALTFTDNPPPNDPMKGVLMLRTLNEQHPENVLVLATLARLAIQTGQYEKALERLNAANGIEPGNKRVICLLAKAYEGARDMEKAAFYSQQCNQ